MYKIRMCASNRMFMLPISLMGERFVIKRGEEEDEESMQSIPKPPQSLRYSLSTRLPLSLGASAM